MENESENVSGRRRFVRKVLGAAALGGIAGLLLGERLDRVSAAPVDGAIPFYASGSETTDDTYFHWNDTDHRLGIGTNSPDATLDARTESGTAVRATSTTGIGVWAHSDSDSGLIGESNSHAAIRGYSKESYGVQGQSDNSFGVKGESLNSDGVNGFSATSCGVIGVTETGVGTAGHAHGSGIGVAGHSNGNGAGVYGDSVNGPGVMV